MENLLWRVRWHRWCSCSCDKLSQHASVLFKLYRCCWAEQEQAFPSFTVPPYKPYFGFFSFTKDPCLHEIYNLIVFPTIFRCGSPSGKGKNFCYIWSHRGLLCVEPNPDLSLNFMLCLIYCAFSISISVSSLHLSFLLFLNPFAICFKSSQCMAKFYYFCSLNFRIFNAWGTKLVKK